MNDILYIYINIYINIIAIFRQPGLVRIGMGSGDESRGGMYNLA